jgi:fibronectin-binding autotransporter adhesin
MAVFGSFRQRVVHSAVRLSGASVAAFSLICAGIPAAEAANFTCSWNDATASWTTVADWSNCNGTFPNNGSGNTFDATIAQGNPTLTTTITIGSDPTKDTVTINNPGAWTLTGPSASATLSGGLSNSGNLNIDTANFDGGSSLQLGSTLSNSAGLNIGNVNLGGTGTTVTAAGLVNTSTVNLTGSVTGGKQAGLIITGAAPARLGNFNISGNALLQFGSGAVTGTDAGTTLSIQSDPTALTLNPGNVTGTFANAGNLNIDTNNFSGGSSLTLGAMTLSNSAGLNIGNVNLGGTGTTVTAAGLVNTSTVNLAGNISNSANQAKVTVNGPASNSGTVNIPINSSVTVTGAGNAYTQTAGFTNLSGGALAAPNVNITGGT